MIELQCHSYYSFLGGASSPGALAARAAQLGFSALALTDCNGLYGAPAFYRACVEQDIQPIIGAQVTVKGGDRILLLCRNGEGYSNLSQLITEACGEASLTQLLRYCEGLICLVGCKEGKLWRSTAWSDLSPYLAIYGDACYVQLTDHEEEGDSARCQTLAHFGLPVVVTGAPRYATPPEAIVHDILCCVAQRKPLRAARRPANHQRYLKARTSPYADCSAAIARQCTFDLDFSSYRFPDYEGSETLRELCVPRPHQRERLEEELKLIERLGLSGYFLIVWDIVRYARSKNIPVQGRGSAANSLVAYLLGITPVDPLEHDLFLGRFLHDEMTTIPDIDLDFANADREQVLDYIYDKYGRDHVAMVCTFVTFRSRSARRELRMALEREPDEALVDALRGIPRHIGVHVGGMLIASKPLAQLVPLQEACRTICQWDKDRVEDAGLIKVDILGLGMLSALRDAMAFAGLDSIPDGDSATYAMLGEADTVGVFQVESRAQMQYLPRTRPQNLRELAIQVALVRPGPLQGNMVKPYIRRRQGREPVSYPHPSLKPILKDTLGVILFQEQVLQIAVTLAGLTPAQASRLCKEEFLAGAAARGIDGAHIYELLKNFAGYGFCKSHALSFASIAYHSAYLKCHHPAAFTAALLRNQPMGFYSPEVLLQDARRHGVTILPVDVNRSSLHASLEDGALRLGLTSVVGPATANRILLQRPYSAIHEIDLDERTLELLIQSGACDSLHPVRREALYRLWSKGRPSPSLPSQSRWDRLLDQYEAMGFGTDAHPLAFLRADLDSQGVTRASDLPNAQGTVKVAGLLICRQRPPTANGFVFLTLEDETGLMNIVVSPAISVEEGGLLSVLAHKEIQEGVINLRAEKICRLRIAETDASSPLPLDCA